MKERYETILSGWDSSHGRSKGGVGSDCDASSQLDPGYATASNNRGITMTAATNTTYLAFRVNNAVPNQLTMQGLPFYNADYTRYGALYAQEQWTPGDPTPSFWMGLKLEKDKLLPVFTLRCPRAGT